ncbi:MAG: hypothetical protein U9N33_00890 [Campylobacterota bacterium]|nr:hypothetical protein [Campylobacterota bacterium]
MNEMYNMSIVTHNYGVIGILVVILINFIMLQRAKDARTYQRSVSIFMPMGMTIIGFVIFTGVVMMAAKHLDFTIENILMILFAIVLIVLENRRSKLLQRLNKNRDDALQTYKTDTYKIYIYEVITVLSISIWMWI